MFYSTQYLNDGPGHPYLSLITLLLHMKTSVLRRLNMLCIMFKIIVFFTTIVLTQQYVRVGIKHTNDASFQNEGRLV